jgi:hypothetical protein
MASSKRDYELWFILVGLVLIIAGLAMGTLGTLLKEKPGVRSSVPPPEIIHHAK